MRSDTSRWAEAPPPLQPRSKAPRAASTPRKRGVLGPSPGPRFVIHEQLEHVAHRHPFSPSVHPGAGRQSLRCQRAVNPAHRSRERPSTPRSRGVAAAREGGARADAAEGELSRTTDPHRYGIHRDVNKSQRKQGALGRIGRVGGASTARSASRRASRASQHAVLNGLFEPVMPIVSTPPWVLPQCPLLARGRGCLRAQGEQMQPRGSLGGRRPPPLRYPPRSEQEPVLARGRGCLRAQSDRT